MGSGVERKSGRQEDEKMEITGTRRREMNAGRWGRRQGDGGMEEARKTEMEGWRQSQDGGMSSETE